MLRLVNANGIQLGANASFGLFTYDRAMCILGKSLRNPSSALMSTVKFRGFAHSTTATAMVCGGILIEFARLSGISVVCLWTSMITLQSLSIIFLEPCFVHMMPMQFQDVKSFPKMIGHVWLLQTINFCVQEQPLISKEHSVNQTGSILVPVAVTTKGHLSFVSFSFKDSKVLRLMQLFVAPVLYKALILMSELLIGKTLPVVGPTAIVQISTKCLSTLCTSL